MDTEIQVLQLQCEDQSSIFPTLVSQHGELVLIDCGYEGQLEQLENELRRLGTTIEQLKAVVITHHDIDHMGGLYDLLTINPSLKVMGSQIDSPYIQGNKTSLRLAQVREYNRNLDKEDLERGRAFEKLLQGVKCCEVDVLLKDWSSPYPFFQILATPGHMPGHISIYVPQQKVLIAADALIWENGKFEIANPAFTLDLSAAIQSVAKILALQPEKIICYHGGMVDKNISPLLQDLIESYTSVQP
jgi:glyoxylase-like metal-dependent hydrolase (beta-lactamase superfamily II)